MAGVRDLAAANAYVETSYLPAHNTRFAIAPASPVDHHRVRDRRRVADADVFCLETLRVIGNDHVVQYQNRGLQLDRAMRGRVPAKTKVVVRELVDGTVHVVYVAADGRERVLPWTPTVPRAPRPPAPTVPPAPPAPSVEPRPAAFVPAADHPWRQQHRRWKEEALARRAQRETPTA